MNQDKFRGSDLAAPNEPHVACVLVLDTSASMLQEVNGVKPIDALNDGLQIFISQTEMDDLAMERVDISIIQFDSDVNVIQDFIPLRDLKAPTLEVGGMTSTGAAMNKAIQLVEDRKMRYRSMGTPYFRPWIFLITDGGPNDNGWETVAAECLEKVKKKKFVCWGVGTPGYLYEGLSPFTDRVIELEGVDFASLFEWLSASMVSVSSSQVGEKIELPLLPVQSRFVPGVE